MSFESATLTERLCRQEYVTGPADEMRFREMVARVQSMARPGDDLPVPAVNAAGEYRRWHALHQAFEKRERQDAVKSASDLQMASQAAATNRRWTQYKDDYQWLLEFEKRNRAEWRLLLEWVGLESADLGSPIPPADSPHARWGRYPGWEGAAGRIREAVHRLQGLTPEERAKIPSEVEMKRLREALQAHHKDLEVLFTAVRQLSQAIEAIQSRLPSQHDLKAA